MQELLEATDLRTLENVVSSIDPTILKLASDNEVLKLASSVGAFISCRERESVGSGPPRGGQGQIVRSPSVGERRAARAAG